METKENNLETIQAVDRAFQVLELISRKGSMNLNDLYKEIKISKPSLLRLAYTLTQNGYLEKDAQSANYSLTLKAYQVGMSSIQNINKISMINATLSDLHKETGRIAQFSVEDGYQIICLQSVGQQATFFSAYTDIGRRCPFYSTSAGKALLATYPNEQIIQMWSHFNPTQFTTNTITDLQSFLQDVSETRRRHYALDLEETEYRVFCIGTAVLGYTNTSVGAISLSGTTLTPEEETQLSTMLLSSARRLSQLLGYVEGPGR